MLDKLLAFGSAFDWISPTVAAVQDIKEGPSVGFRISETAGWSGAQIRDMLREDGVKSWGWMIVNGWIIFEVRKDRAKQALATFERHGIMYQGG